MIPSLKTTAPKQNLFQFSVPPRFTSDLSDTLRLKTGSSSAVEVPFAGNPQPKVTWTYNDKPLSNKRIKTETIVNMTSMTLAKVIRNDSGPFKVTLENEHGQCSFTINLIVLDKPSPPTNLTVTGFSETSINLKWSEPEDDGGCEITGYVIEKREANKRSWTKVDEITEMELSCQGLTKDCQYVFRVAAKNECGLSDFVELSKPVTAKSEHGK